MADQAVVNTSPLVFLARAGLFDLLTIAAPAIVVPTEVAAELRRRGDADAAVRAMTAAAWLTVVEAPDAPASIQSWDLGPGESAVLSWAIEHGPAVAVIDDLAGRRCGAALGVPIRGTLGLVLAAKQRGRVPAARPVMEDLRRSGMYLSDKVLDSALGLVGE